MTRKIDNNQLNILKSLMRKMGQEHLRDALWLLGIKDSAITDSTLRSLSKNQAKRAIRMLRKVENGSIKWLVWKDVPGRYSNKYHQNPLPPSGANVVYFISINNEFVKIGITSDLEGRLKDLQMCNPYFIKVEVAIPGGYHLETKYHQRFSQYREHGEWFRLSPEIREEIENLK